MVGFLRYGHIYFSNNIACLFSTMVLVILTCMGSFPSGIFSNIGPCVAVYNVRNVDIISCIYTNYWFM